MFSNSYSNKDKISAVALILLPLVAGVLLLVIRGTDNSYVGSDTAMFLYFVYFPVNAITIIFSVVCIIKRKPLFYIPLLVTLTAIAAAFTYMALTSPF